MSILEFTQALRNKASDSAASKQAKDLLDRLAKQTTNAYTSNSPMRRAAAILTEDAKAFRESGAKQGRTRLIVTEDTLKELLEQFGVTSISEEQAIQLYMEFLSNTYGQKYKASHFEFYTTSGDALPATRIKTPLGEYVKSLENTPVIAIRGLNFSHENTLKHMAQFLMYAKPNNIAGLTLKEVQEAISRIYERGHIIATTTGRQQVSIGNISDENTVLDKIVQLSVDLDIATSSLSNPKYAKILSSVNKDFSGSRMFMNIEFQLIRNETKTGNQDSADITRGLRIISTLYNLLDNIKLSSRGALLSAPVATNLKNAAKQMDNLLKKLEKQEQYITKVLAGYITDPAKYILDLKSSDTFKEQIRKRIVAPLKSTADAPVLKVNHNNVVAANNRVAPEKITSVKTDIKKLVDQTKKDLENAKRLQQESVAKSKRVESNQINLTSLQSLLNKHLQDVITANMGDGSRKNILNYRTGRFASTVKVEQLSESRAGMITAFYSYMKNPYATFSQGGRQSVPTSRDPKLLIAGSIREIAATMVGNRMRSVAL